MKTTRTPAFTVLPPPLGFRLRQALTRRVGATSRRGRQNLRAVLCAFGLFAACVAHAQENSAPAPPPSAPPELSAAELEKLVAPIALYPDALVATILPASVYPLEIVQAARFVADTNNLARIDEQPWDDNVKAVARVPEAIKKLNDDLPWTIQLGEAFLAQDKAVMDAIQRLRLKSQKAGMLQTSEQMIVFVTNTVTETKIEQQVVMVTNTIVQIESASPQVIYVPQYNPVYVYAPPPTYVYNPVDPFFTFAAGVAVGAIIANNCDWGHGGCYHNDVDINIDRNVNRNVNRNTDRASARQTSGQGQKWKPDQNRLNRSGGAGTTSARSQEARGWGGGARPSAGNTGARPSTGTVGSRPSTGTAGNRPSTGTAGTRPSTGNAAARPSTGGASAARPSAGSSSANRPAASPSASRPSPSPSASQSRSSPSSGSAFSGASSGANARASSNRGASSRSSGGGGRGGGGRR